MKTVKPDQVRNDTLRLTGHVPPYRCYRNRRRVIYGHRGRDRGRGSTLLVITETYNGPQRTLRLNGNQLLVMKYNKLNRRKFKS